jgi:hypothetical protein
MFAIRLIGVVGLVALNGFFAEMGQSSPTALHVQVDYVRVVRHSGGIQSTPVRKRKDCDVIMQQANLSTPSRSTAELDVEQITVCVDSRLGK